MPPKNNTPTQRQRKRSRKNSQGRAIKKYPPLCVSRGFVAFAFKKGWDDPTVDAAAWIFHRWFLARKKNDKGWVPVPYQELEAMFGKNYVKILKLLLESGFLERNEQYKYLRGHHCYHYRIHGELRNDKITAAYRLKSPVFPKRFIKNKEYWKRMSEAKRLKRIITEIQAAFNKTRSGSENNDKRFSELVVAQMETFTKLIINAHRLKVQISDDDLTAIAEKRYTEKQTDKYDFDAYEQRIRDMIDRTHEPRFSIDDYGRLHVPITNLPRELWDYVQLEDRQLAAVDIKSSHVYCLLALLKDIEINYFTRTGTHQERLAKCKLSNQMTMITGLKEHLYRTSIFHQLGNYFKCTKDTLDNNLINKFTRKYYKIYKEMNIHKLQFHNLIFNHSRFKQYLQTILFTDLHSVTDNNNTEIQSIPLQLSSSISSIYVPPDSVGVQVETPLYQGLLKILLACRFTLKTVEELNQPTTETADVPLFRNLFFPCPKEISDFEKMLDGDIYSLLMKTIGIDQSMSRHKFKRAFFHFLYRPAFRRHDKIRHEDGTIEKIEEPVRKAMMARLPSIVFFLDVCKCCPGTLDPRWEYYKRMARAIQSIESQIMLECCANLWKKYPDMFLVTVHDCIKCLPEDVEKVQAELKSTFEKYHVSPKFEVKYHKKPNHF